MKSRPYRLLLSTLLFQLTWVGIVTTAAAAPSWMPMAYAIILWAFVLLIYRRGPYTFKVRNLLIVTVALIGTGAEVLALKFNFYTPRHSSPSLFGLTPIWLCMLWISFATTLIESLDFLRGRAWLASAVGACSGWLSYLAAQQLGAIELNNPWLVACMWAILLPLLLKWKEYVCRA